MKESKLRQNEAHGLLLRVNIFLSAYFEYRNIAVPEEEKVKFAHDEKMIIVELNSFLAELPNMHKYS